MGMHGLNDNFLGMRKNVANDTLEWSRSCAVELRSCRIWRMDDEGLLEPLFELNFICCIIYQSAVLDLSG